MKQNKFIVKPQLAGDDFFWQGNQIGVLLIHGFTASTATVRPAAEKLHASGITVAGPLLPGHGTHPDDLNRATWQMWLQKVKNYYEKMLDVCQDIYILGNSMGALLALELAAQHPEIAGVLHFSPALKVKNLWLAPLLAPFKDYLNKQPKADDLHWKGYNVYPLKAAGELLKLQRHVKSILPKIHQPLGVFTGKHDQRVSNQAVTTLVNQTNSLEKHLYHFENSGHFILIEQEKDLAISYILKFIAAQSSFKNY